MAILKKAIFSLLFICKLIDTSSASILYECKPDSLIPDQDFTSVKTATIRQPILDSAWTIMFDLSKSPFISNKMFSFLQTSCFRFDFALDSITISDPGYPVMPDSQYYLTLFSFGIVQGNKIKPENQVLFSIRIVRSNNEWVLAYMINQKDGEEGIYKRAAVLNPLAPYCLSMHTEIGQDSIVQNLEFSINGITSFETDISEYSLRIKEFAAAFLNGQWPIKFSGHIYINNIAFGDSWLGNPPKRPDLSESLQKSHFTSDQILLFSPQYKSFIMPSTHLATQYQIISPENNFNTPLFDSGNDTLNRDSIIARLKLDTNQVYIMRIRHYSTDGNSSEWSFPGALSYCRDSIKPATFHTDLVKTDTSKFGSDKIILSVLISFVIGTGFYLLIRKNGK